MKKMISMSPVFILLLSLALSACVAKETDEATATGTEEKIKTGTEVRSGWQEEWERVVREAKKEGNIAIYAAFGSPVKIALIESFKQKYGMELDITMGRAPEISQKLITENRAGLNLADVIIAGASSITTIFKPSGLLSPLEPLLLLPEVRDPQAWWQKKLPFLDKDKIMFQFISRVSAPITINTDMVKAGEIVYMRDILHPRWKGKITMNDPTMVGGTLGWFAVFSELLGHDFMRDLAKMEPAIISDRRLVVEWIARGRYPIGLAASTESVEEFITFGAPLASIIPKEGAYVSAGAGVVSIVAKAPHPNAAKLFINWLLSREGQTIYSKAQETPSNRVDVATDHVSPIIIRHTGVNYLSTDDEEFLLTLPQKQKEAKDIFGPLIK
ncbi:MAG: extracellular solute-binding protein [Chloroflexi bacterium]|nr:extracellular solute-binding protein [Chloroflexota bacterium]